MDCEWSAVEGGTADIHPATVRVSAGAWHERLDKQQQQQQQHAQSSKCSSGTSVRTCAPASKSAAHPMVNEPCAKNGSHPLPCAESQKVAEIRKVQLVVPRAHLCRTPACWRQAAAPSRCHGRPPLPRGRCGQGSGRRSWGTAAALGCFAPAATPPHPALLEEGPTGGLTLASCLTQVRSSAACPRAGLTPQDASRSILAGLSARKGLNKADAAAVAPHWAAGSGSSVT